MAEAVRVGIVGFGWMGQVHARAYARLLHHYLDSPLKPILVAAADSLPDRLHLAMRSFGCTDVYTDWHELIQRDDLDLISITGPNFIHRDVGVAAARAGKHIWVEKPAGRNATDAAQIAEAVRSAGVQSAAGFNYRNAPAVELTRQLVANGRIGTVTSVNIRLLTDYAAHPEGGLTWRFQNEWAGSGVLGDLVSHGIDLGRYLVGEITDVVCDSTIVIPSRPQAAGAVSHYSRGGGPMGQVENEDYAWALLRFEGGARGTLESSRAAVGEQCTYQIEIHGERGALSWDFRRMGELQLCLDQDYQNASYATHQVAIGDGEFGLFQPGAGIPMGFDDLKVIEAHRLIQSIASGHPVGATIEDAVRTAELVDALAESASQRRWVKAPPIGRSSAPGMTERN
jgi:predicted dehydrogenase